MSQPPTIACFLATAGTATRAWLRKTCSAARVEKTGLVNYQLENKGF
jgi:hypothetical protein